MLELEAGKMGKLKDLSEFDKGQIVMARWLGQSISKTGIWWTWPGPHIYNHVEQEVMAGQFHAPSHPGVHIF